jgi:hypothetical protein
MFLLNNYLFKKLLRTNPKKLNEIPKDVFEGAIKAAINLDTQGSNYNFDKFALLIWPLRFCSCSVCFNSSLLTASGSIGLPAASASFKFEDPNSNRFPNMNPKR